ncbi:MAG TPA: hypothetical protein VGO98_00835 [Candidatus Saccharimonadales bacterium]|jgi:hypothetical protein|nr:hypothetical protein [Candidatus Saccharimonadales bacterium]
MRVNVKPTTQKNNRRGIVVLVIVIAILVATVGLWRYLQIGYAGDRAEVSALESAAGQFQPGSGWTQDENTITGSFQCWGVNPPCRSVLRRWYPDHRLTRDEFQRLLDKAGWSLAIKGDCNPPAYASGLVTLCTAQGIVGSYDVDVSIISETKSKPDLVSLRMVKIGN